MVDSPDWNTSVLNQYKMQKCFPSPLFVCLSVCSVTWLSASCQQRASAGSARPTASLHGWRSRSKTTRTSERLWGNLRRQFRRCSVAWQTEVWNLMLLLTFGLSADCPQYQSKYKQFKWSLSHFSLASVYSLKVCVLCMSSLPALSQTSSSVEKP